MIISFIRKAFWNDWLYIKKYIIEIEETRQLEYLKYQNRDTVSGVLTSQNMKIG